MRTLVQRWRSMSDAEIDRIGENIIAIHWVIMALVILGWRLLPLVLGVSPELLTSRIW